MPSVRRLGRTQARFAARALSRDPYRGRGTPLSDEVSSSGLRYSQTFRLWHADLALVPDGRFPGQTCAGTPFHIQRPVSTRRGAFSVRSSGVGELLGYARVSSAEQNAELQADALAAAGCWRVFTDSASGALDRRPELDRLLEQLRPGDTLVVWRLDRLGRSLRHLLDVVTDLSERGVGFRSLTESIDTTTSGGRLIFHVFGALAEFEREIIRERTQAGLAAARARGRKGGRPALMTPDKVKAARRMYDQRDMTVAEIGAVLGVSRGTVYRALGRDVDTRRTSALPPAPR